MTVTIIRLNIPTGIPLVYTLAEDLPPLCHDCLGAPNASEPATPDSVPSGQCLADLEAKGVLRPRFDQEHGAARLPEERLQYLGMPAHEPSVPTDDHQGYALPHHQGQQFLRDVAPAQVEAGDAAVLLGAAQRAGPRHGP